MKPLRLLILLILCALCCPTTLGQQATAEARSLTPFVLTIPREIIDSQYAPYCDPHNLKNYKYAIVNYSAAPLYKLPSTPKNIKTRKLPTTTIPHRIDVRPPQKILSLIQDRQNIPRASVHTEEFVNAAPYEYAHPGMDSAFSLFTDIAACPWNTRRRLLQVGIRTSDTLLASRPKNITLLIGKDVGNYTLCAAHLVAGLRPNDRLTVLIPGQNDSLKCVVNAQPLTNKKEILSKILSLQSEDYAINIALLLTNVYEVARKNYIPEAENQVIAVGDQYQMTRGYIIFPDPVVQNDFIPIRELIVRESEAGITFSAVMFDLEKVPVYQHLATAGGGRNAFVDNRYELLHASDSLFPLATDVDMRVEFDPELVRSYKLVGYETRLKPSRGYKYHLAAITRQTDLGPRRTVTALYEIALQPKVTGGKLCDVKINYRDPRNNTLCEISQPIVDHCQPIADASLNLKIATSVAALTLLLRRSISADSFPKEQVVELLQSAKSYDTCWTEAMTNFIKNYEQKTFL